MTLTVANSRCSAFALALAMLVAPGCAQVSGWRAGSVKDVTTLSAVSSSVDVDCVKASSRDQDPRVAVVAYRGARALYWRAFQVPDDSGVRVGDPVYIEPSLCRLRELPSAVPAPSNGASPQ